MTECNIERHPLEPFLPETASVLMLGSFPPKKEKWSMEFFYPNFINDMWRILGLIFFSDKEHFILRDRNGKLQKSFDKKKITAFCSSAGIALYDTATQVIRLKDNASDKFLEVVTPTDLRALLKRLPKCSAIITTGQKATDIAIETFKCEEPKVGEKSIIAESGIRLWRMPSSSRAYPMSLEKKAEHYRRLFEEEGFLQQ